jgi:hypothetical protein
MHAGVVKIFALPGSKPGISFWGRLGKTPPGACLSLSAEMKFIPREGEVALCGKFSNPADNPFHSPG